MRKVAIAALGVLLLGMLAVPALASHPEVSLAGSDFEIDTDANLRQDDPAPSEDWATIPQGSGTGQERRQTDTASGQNDESFGQGTKEDTAVPSVVTGGIPPNKSDLKFFGVYLEDNGASGKFLNVFWARVQDPSGTTNMDFEFNKSSTTSANGITPVRTAGDILIQYDLSNGGVNPNIFISRWLTSGPGSACEAGNSLPCWSDKVNLTAIGDAAGSINTTAIPALESDGLGGLSPRTFGEAQIDFGVFGGSDPSGCVGFGSAYLKSRSSDSFTSALKDFIPPAALNFNNCGAIEVTKTAKHAASGSSTPVPQAGVTFTIAGQTVVTNAQGKACVGDLQIGNSYDVVETVPAGYVADGPTTKSVLVDSVGSCASGFETVSFSNTPLTDLTVSVNSQVDGGTASTIDCVASDATVIIDAGTDATGDGSGTATNLLPDTYTCTVVIDP